MKTVTTQHLYVDENRRDDFSDLLIVRGLQAGTVRQEGLGGRSSKAKNTR